MVQHIALILLSVLVAVLSVVLWVVARKSLRQVAAYKTALENNQKKLDQQTARLTMLVRCLSNLSSLVDNTMASDNWQPIGLDEARALIAADGASYWRYLRDKEEFELQLARGLESSTKISNLKMTDKDVVVEAGKIRVASIRSDHDIVSEQQSSLAVPLVVGNELWGVFRFTRKGDQILSREGDLISMLIRQLALVIENRNMIQNREKFYLELVQTLAEILEQRDATGQGKAVEARRLSREMAKELDMPDEFIYYLEFAALLHDIGKIAIDESVIKKPGKLTEQEYEIMKKHPELGYKILAPVTMLAPVAPMVLYHQEWFNGKGYPEGLSGEEIPLGSRIVAVLDAWGAMTSAHPWRAALPREEAIKEIKKGAGTQFDPRVVEAFMTVLDRQGVGLRD